MSEPVDVLAPLFGVIAGRIPSMRPDERHYSAILFHPLFVLGHKIRMSASDSGFHGPSFTSRITVPDSSTSTSAIDQLGC